ncbi:MAG: SCP2 sterol-binding domain-containing protein [Pseudomonadales bacterium]|nr:SCP2 sterol-binding domain-containing protein [Pseudomonadales bacterium]
MPALVNQAQLNVLQLLINKALKLDPLAQQRLNALAQKSLRIQCNEPDIDIVILVENESITLHVSELYLNNDETEKKSVTCHLSGNLSAYSKLLSEDDKAAALINSDLRLQGDSSLLMELEKIVSQVELDWEYHLAKLIGDLPAHFIGKRGRQSWYFLRATQPIFMRHLQEFILEEAQLCPNKLEMEQFIESVQSIEERSDRLQARIQRLQKRLAAD